MIPHSAPHLPYKTSEERGDSAPLHPGEVLREDFMPYLGLTSADLARKLGLGLSAVDELLAEQSPITADLAIRLAAAFGLQARFWLALQMQHDLWHDRIAAVRGTEFRPQANDAAWDLAGH